MKATSISVVPNFASLPQRESQARRTSIVMPPNTFNDYTLIISNNSAHTPNGGGKQRARSLPFPAPYSPHTPSLSRQHTLLMSVTLMPALSDIWLAIGRALLATWYPKILRWPKTQDTSYKASMCHRTDQPSWQWPNMGAGNGTEHNL